MQARGSTQYPLRSRSWHWINNKFGTRYVCVTICKEPTCRAIACVEIYSPSATPCRERRGVQNKSTELIFVEHEKGKKGKHQQRVIDVEMGSFNSPVFGTNGGMWKECKLCLSNLADKLSRKSGESYASAISWLRTRISFEILRSVYTFVPASRTPFHKNARWLFRRFCSFSFLEDRVYYLGNFFYHYNDNKNFNISLKQKEKSLTKLPVTQSVQSPCLGLHSALLYISRYKLTFVTNSDFYLVHSIVTRVPFQRHNSKIDYLEWENTCISILHSSNPDAWSQAWNIVTQPLPQELHFCGHETKKWKEINIWPWLEVGSCSNKRRDQYLRENREINDKRNPLYTLTTMNNIFHERFITVPH